MVRGAKTHGASPGTFSLGKGLGVVALLFIAAGVPTQSAAQTDVTIRGRVFDAGSRDGVSNAVLTLVGHGYTLSSGSGSFSFEGVEPGDYRLTVEAYGYRSSEQALKVGADTILTVGLFVDPVFLRGIDVKLERFDFDGRVRDSTFVSNLQGAEVMSDQGHSELTNVHGSFDLDDVFERIPLRVLIRAYGYMPLDTTFVPDGDGRHPFHVVPDPVMGRLVDNYIKRLEVRADGHMYDFRPPVNRQDMARLPGNASLQVVMEANYYRHILRRVGCFFIDEERVLSREERTHRLQSLMVSELQRIELLEFVSPGGGRAFVVRVYTRAFFQRTVDARDLPLTKLRLTDCSSTRD